VPTPFVDTLNMAPRARLTGGRCQHPAVRPVPPRSIKADSGVRWIRSNGVEDQFGGVAFFGTIVNELQPYAGPAG